MKQPIKYGQKLALISSQIGHKILARLIITRPEPKASQTAAALHKKGHEATAFPLTRLEALPHHLPHQGQDIAPYIIITSANALRFLSPELHRAIQAQKAYCVGAKTAQAAKQAGLHIEAMAPNAAELLPLLPHSHFTYLCSAHRTPWLEDHIDLKRLQIIETYHAPTMSPDNHSQPQHNHYDGALFYSARAAQAWAQWNITADYYFCLSAAIASQLPKGVKKQAILANQPDSTHLFTMIDKKFPPK